MLGIVTAIVLTAPALDGVVAADLAYYQAFYEDLHRHPEVAFKETRTSAKVADEMRRLGLTTTLIGGGVVGILDNGAGPVTIVRSELDALPMSEETGLPYSSETPGVMHACGHDLHATALVATADAMQKLRKSWHGTLVFIGQPAEEILSGARAMFDAGLARVIPKPNQAVALHGYYLFPTGEVGFPPPGPVQTAADNFDLTFRGVSTHGSMPHKGIDPILLASQFVVQVQTLVSREVEPGDMAVISVGTFHGGTARNIIANEVKLQVTMRTYEAATRARLLKRIEQMAFGLAQVAGAPEPTMTMVEAVPPVVNDRALEERFRAGVTKRLGAETVIDVGRTTASEDFALYGPTLGIPVLRFFVGTASDPSFSIANHSSKYAPKTATVLPLATKAMVAGLLELHH